MNTKKKTIKSIIGTAGICSALLVSGFTAAQLTKPNFNTYAVYKESLPISIPNSNFNQNTKSSYPFAPDSFSAYTGFHTTSSSSNDEDGFKSGVINLANEDYETKFSLAKRNSLDNYVLMIDASRDVNFGYKTKNPTKLDPNSKYMFTVDVFSLTDNNNVHLYLFDKDNTIFSSINNINAHNDWKTYSFFVATNNLEGIELTLGMYLEGKGTVLFDNLSAQKLSDMEYEVKKSNLNSNKYAENITEVDNIVKTYHVENNSLTDGENYFNFTDAKFEAGKNSVVNYVDNLDGTNQKAILINNFEKTYRQYETDDVLAFAPNRLYQVSVNAKTENLNGTATLKLVRTDLAEDDKNYSDSTMNKTISISSNTTTTEGNLTNDYKTYSFYIKTDSEVETSYKLMFGLGSEENLTSGKLYLSEIEISKINTSTFTSADSTNKIDLTKQCVNSKIMLNNGYFNTFEIEDYNLPMPAKATDWTISSTNTTQKFGVVNTKTFYEDLKHLNISNKSNPSVGENNNVLMMYNAQKDVMSYKSTAKSLEANSYHKFEIDVQTQNAPLTLSLVTTLNDEEFVLSSKTINSNNWQTVAMFIHTGYQKLDVSLKATLDSSSYAYAYLDNAKFDFPNEFVNVEEEYESATDSDTTSKVDLSNLLTSDSNDNFALSNNFSFAEMSTSVRSGIITLNSSKLDGEVITNNNSTAGAPTNLEMFNSLNTDKVLAIWTTEDVNYSVSSKLGFDLATDKYYKISVDVFTQNIDSNNSEIDKTLLGANISLSGFENTFTSITSNNVWSTYTFYVKVDSATTTYLNFALGSEDAQTKGAAFFGNIMFDDTLTENEYASAVDSNFVKVVKPIEKTEDEKDPETDKTENNKKGLGTAWLYIIPGLLTALAIIIAVVGFGVRKIKWKKPFTKKTKNAYDRNKTVSVQYYTRKATVLREEKIRELTQDLTKVNNERKQFEETYKQDLTKLREMKIKRANAQEIAKLEKEMKKNQKLSSTLGVTANRISTELEYVKTDLYLNSLVKKLAREQSSSTQENSDENK